MAREWRSTAALALAAAVTLVGLIGAERASAEGIASGATRLELNRGLFKALKKDEVRMTKVGLGRVSGRVVKAPVSGGLIDVATANGWIDSSGGVRFRAGRRSVQLAQLTLDTSKGVLRGVLAGQKMEIAAVPRYEFSRVGWGDVIEVSRLRLTRRVSSLINRKLDLDLFRPGRAFAAVSSSIQPEWDQMLSGTFQLDLDSGTVAKIESLGVDVQTPGSTAQGSEPPVFAAPLIAGSIDPAMVHIFGQAEGGLRVSDADAPSPEVSWFNLGYSFETGKLLSTALAHTEAGQLAPAPPGPLAAVDLAGATVSVDSNSRTVTITNARATLEAGTADYINTTFAQPKGKAPVVAAGDPLGTFSMTMQGR
jgi:hypothetical protein